MTIKRNEQTKKWEVSVSMRIPGKGPRTKRRKGIESKSKAVRVERELMLELAMQKKSVTSPPWAIVIQEYLERMKKRKLQKRTIDNARYGLNAHTLPIWGTRLVCDISSEEVEDLIQDELDYLSVSQRKNILKYIRGAMRVAHSKRYIQYLPTFDIAFEENDKIKEVLKESEVRIFLNEARKQEHEWYPIWFFACVTGMRNGELLALKWDTVNLDNRQIKVNKTYDKKVGLKNHTKARYDRFVYISDPLLAVLKDLKFKYPNEDFVLPRISTWLQGSQAKVLREFLESLNLTSVRFHDLRATWATLLLVKGTPPVKVMTMGGWIDFKTFQIYVRQAGVDIQGITDCLNNIVPDYKSHSISFSEELESL